MESPQRIINLIREYFGKCESALTEVRAIYLWGSILRPDFVPELSDIDCVAMCDPGAEESELQKIRDDLRTNHRELARLNLRCLYICDLNGQRPRSELAQLIDPRLLLADFPSWVWVWGCRLSLSSFALRPCNLHQAYMIRVRALKSRVQRCMAVPQAEAPLYALKEAVYLIHLFHQLNHGVHPFSYSDLERHSNSVTAPLSRAIPRLRRNGWPDMECEQTFPLVLELLDQIAAGYPPFEMCYPTREVNSLPGKPNVRQTKNQIAVVSNN